MLGISDMNTLTSPSDIISTNLPENNSDHYFNNCIYIFSDLDFVFLYCFYFILVEEFYILTLFFL